MGGDFIEAARAVADRLRILDKQRVVFGSKRHHHRFNTPLPVERVEAFESTYNISLPEPYRRFITELGNGGTGPYYGVMPLKFEAPQLRHAFPSTQRFELDDGDADEAWGSPVPGSIYVSEYGCGTYMILVVRGEAAGQVWADARYYTGISPMTDRQSIPMTFDTWWLAMMREELEKFETIRSLMNSATPHEEIHGVLEPRTLQLDVDQAMLSLMNCDPKGEPKSYAKKPWGRSCGLVEDHYEPWLREQQRMGPRIP
jgi:hypothetical protein